MSALAKSHPQKTTQPSATRVVRQWLRALSGIALLLLGPAASAQVERKSIFEILGETRPVEGYLSGAPPYRPYLGPAATPEGRNVARMRRFAKLEVHLRREATTSPEAAHHLAILELVSSRAESAVRRLEDLLLQDPANVHVRNDLAVAYAHRAHLNDEPFDLVRALSTLENAPDIIPDTAEYSFNRALIMQQLGILASARNAWSEFLDRGTETGWVEEGRRRLGRLPNLEEPPSAFADRIRTALEDPDPSKLSAAVRGATQEARLFVEEVLLPEWSDAQNEGHLGRATTALHALRRVSEQLVRETGDPMLSETTDGIEEAIREPWRPAQADLVAGFRSYKEGIRALDRLDIVPARSSLNRAKDSLGRAESPFRLWASLYLAVCDNHERRFEEAHARLREIIEESGRRGFSALQARALWIRGFAYHISGHPAGALLSFRQAREAFVRLGELEHAAFLALLVAEAYDLLGQSEAAWRYRHTALMALGKHVFGRRAAVVLTSASENMSNHGFSKVALLMQNDALHLAREQRSPVDEAESLWRRALIYERLGRTRESTDDIDAATPLVAQVRDESVRGLIESNLDRVRAELLLSHNPQLARAELTGILNAYRSSNYRYFLLDALRMRARAYAAENDFQSARADLLEGIDEAEQQLRGVPDKHLRLTLLDKEERVFDELLVLEGLQGRGRDSLAFAERARARGILDSIAGGDDAVVHTPAPTLDPSTILHRLPAKQALVIYEIAADWLVTWVVRSEGIKHDMARLERAHLTELVGRLRDGIVHKDEKAVDEAATALYAILVAPVEQQLVGVDTIVLSPDETLYEVPFAALRNPRSSRYLVQDFAIGITPSASVYLAVDQQLTEDPSGPRLLVVANPSFDRNVYPRLPLLPKAEELARTVARRYQHVTVLTGDEASVARFSEHLKHVDLVHFGGHAVVNRGDPALSQLLFSPGTDGTDLGVLYARDVVRLDLARIRLVVLSACSSASGQLSAAEGLTSLASAFIEAGVRNVVAGLWEVEDSSSAALFQDFYERVLNGESPVDALRHSQLQLLSVSPIESMKAWAGFVLVGRVDAGQRLGGSNGLAR